jgi:hypothetical protein
MNPAGKSRVGSKSAGVLLTGLINLFVSRLDTAVDIVRAPEYLGI